MYSVDSNAVALAIGRDSRTFRAMLDFGNRILSGADVGKITIEHAAETARCVTNNDALNLIAQYLGGDADARTNAEAIGNIAKVVSAGGGGLTEYEKMIVETPRAFFSQEEYLTCYEGIRRKRSGRILSV